MKDTIKLIENLNESSDEDLVIINGIYYTKSEINAVSNLKDRRILDLYTNPEEPVKHSDIHSIVHDDELNKLTIKDVKNFKHGWVDLYELLVNKSYFNNYVKDEKDLYNKIKSYNNNNELFIKYFIVNYIINRGLNETSYSRIYQHTQDDSTFAIIGSEDKDTKENRFNELLDLIRKLGNKQGKGIGFNEVKGTYTYEGKNVTQEDSLIVYNITKEQALDIANKLNQESIVWKDPNFFGLLYADGRVMTEFQNEKGNNMSFSNAEKEGFGTKVNKDKKNRFGFTFEGYVLYPRRYNKELTEEDLREYFKFTSKGE